MSGGASPSFELLLTGCKGVGRGSVLRRYTENTFDDEELERLDTSVTDEKIKTIDLASMKITLHISLVDIRKHYQYPRYSPTRYYFGFPNEHRYRRADGIIFIYDITDDDSFYSIEDLITRIAIEYSVPMVLIGNKTDLESSREMENESGEELAQQLGIPFLETSAKLNTNIDEAFEILIRQMAMKIPQCSDILKDFNFRSARSLFQKGMEEGYVLLTNKKIVLSGPPCVGKTSFKSLLFNWPAPKQHSSTAIASRPVQAIERIADQTEGKIWDVVKVDDLFQMLSDAIRNADKIKKESHKIQSTASPSPTHTCTNTLPAQSHVSTTPSTAAVPIASSSPTPSLPMDATTPSTLTPVPTRDADYYSEEILDYLASSQNEHHVSQELHQSTWIHLLDSGGQPQFADMLRIFMRGNSLYVIVMKITEALQDKPTFTYSLDGTILNAPRELQMTNLQIIENFVRSVAASRNSVITIGDKEIISKPAFIVIATHCDRSRLRRLVGLDESLKQKNAELMSCLSEFLDLFIFYDAPSNGLIFPVDNLCWWNRKKISADIRQRVMSRKDIGFTVPIPIRWYMFEIKVKEKISKESHGMLSLDSCYAVGAKLDMTRSEVDQCLVFLDSLSMCIYYPAVLPNVIFTDVQYLLDTLTNIVRVSFVDALEAILPKGVSLSPDTLELLKVDGIFDESLLNNLGLKFVPPLFTKSDFLRLLQHLYVIAPIDTPGRLRHYFMPIVLPTDRLTSEQKQVFSTSIDPLLITFNSKLVLQGLFPTLIVFLLSRKEEPRFFVDSRSSNFPRQLRYAVKLYSEHLFGSVFLCDNYKTVEVYFTGLPQHCYLLRQVILQALSASAKTLAYDLETLKFSALVYCTRKHMLAANDRKPHPVTISFRETPPAIGCSVEDLPVAKVTDERQSCWLIEPVSSTVPVSNVLPENGILNEAHAPVILSAISDLVDEWEVLGIHLGLKNSVLQEIKCDCHQFQTRRKEMIIRWLQQGSATCQHLISALRTLERGDIIAKIESLYSL